MPYQVAFNKKSGTGRKLTDTAYSSKPDAQRYADELNKNSRGRNARVVVAKKGTFSHKK